MVGLNVVSLSYTNLKLDVAISAHLVVRNSMSLFVFSSVSMEESSSSSRSALICGRLPTLPPRLTLDEVEDELRPESATGDGLSRRKSKPPSAGRRDRAPRKRRR